MESLLASNEEKVRTFGLSLVRGAGGCFITEELCVAVETGPTHRRADGSAGPVQEDQGRDGSHTGWVPHLLSFKR